MWRVGILSTGSISSAQAGLGSLVLSACGGLLRGPTGVAAQDTGVREIRLETREIRWELAPGKVVRALAYNGRVPGPEIRLKEGERVRVVLHNALAAPTAIHWHGIDEPTRHHVHGIPHQLIPAGATFAYEFEARPAGTRWYHRVHFGEGIDIGLAAPLIIDPAEADPFPFDREVTLVLDDWATGTSRPLPLTLAGTAGARGSAGGMMARMSMGPMGCGMASGGPATPLYDTMSINGKAYPAVGAIGVSRVQSGGFSDADIALLQTFADQALIAIENVRLFKELEAANRELAAASQHKSEFLANMSHELRTPLNAIIGFSEVLGERMFGELNDKQDEYLKDIHASGQHLLSLINDILDLSKIEAGRMELELTDFDIPTAIDNALTLVRERAGRRGIVLHQAADAGVGQLPGDERKIKQVLLNLLSNAIKFTPDGGRIDVRARAVEGSVEVSVSDTGVGIAPEDQEAIFEEFRQVGTADKKVEGTGLGLALSRRFIELHGGRIWVESQVRVGSTFTFTIPIRTGA